MILEVIGSSPIIRRYNVQNSSYFFFFLFLILFRKIICQIYVVPYFCFYFMSNNKSSHYNNQSMINTLLNWVYTTNHKNVGLLYLVFGMISGLVAVLMSLLIRMELSFPGDQILLGN